jgi:hypothetical protein
VFDDIVMWVADTPPVLSTAPGVFDVIEFEYRASPTARFTAVVLAQNIVLPTPQVRNAANSAFGTQTTSHLVPMPATVVAGDLLLIIFSTDTSQTALAPTTPTGWTQLISNATGGSVSQVTIYGKVATGAEGGTTVDVVTANATRAASIIYRIDRWFGTLSGVTVTGGVNATSTTPDPPSHTPGWTDRSLWFAVWGATGNSLNGGFPANYATAQNSQSTGAPAASAGSAQRVLYAASDNPGTFTITNGNWAAFTLAVRPPA